MSTTTQQKRIEQGKDTSPRVEKNARLSNYRRRARPQPATRAEADDLYAPNSAYKDKLVTPPRLARMLQLGLIPQWTNAEAHQMILDAMYDDAGLLRLEHTPQPTETA